MNPKIALVLALMLSGNLDLVRADAEAGVDWYVRNARVIAIVQAETKPEAQAFPSPRDSERVWVKEVLKGVDSRQEFLLPSRALLSGERAVVLIQYVPPNDEDHGTWSPGTQPKMSIWPADLDGNVNTLGVPEETEDGMSLDQLELEALRVKLDVIKADIASSSPEEVGLNGQILDALFFPDKLKALATQDAARAIYVRFVVAILDLDRDVPFLAQLLESPDTAVRAAAAKRLVELTGAKVPAAKDETPQALNEWAQTWASQKPPTPPIASRWPPVPADFQAPPSAFPSPLLLAVRKKDPDAFAREFAFWLDSGVMRDREIDYSIQLDQKIVEGSHLYGAFSGESAYLPEAPRLRPDVIFNQDIPVVDRMKVIALLAQIFDDRRLNNERMEAKALVFSAAPDSDILKRIAFWEESFSFAVTITMTMNTHGEETEPIGEVALERMVENDNDESTQRFFLDLCLKGNERREMETPQEDEVQAGNNTFYYGILAYVKTHQDQKAQGWALDLGGRKEVIPILLSWLKSKDLDLRMSAAHCLYYTESAEAVPGLLDAISVEPNPDAKTEMLSALAETRNKRGLDALLAAARDLQYVDDEAESQATIIRGLGWIGDPKALPVLADLAERIVPDDSTHKDDLTQLGGLGYDLPDLVDSFGTISHVYEPRGTSDAVLKQEIEKIEQWRKSQAGQK